MDLSKLSDADLMALKAGDLTKVSDQGLMQLRGGAAPAQAAAPEGPSFGRRVRDMLAPTVEGLGAVGGGLIGTAAMGPIVGTGVGAGLGYGIGKGTMRLIDQAAGWERPPENALSGVITGATDVALGTLMQRGVDVAAPALARWGAKGFGWAKDAVGGMRSEVKAGQIARDALGPDLGAVRNALQQAPKGMTAAQASANVNSPTWQALAQKASTHDPRFFGGGPLTPAQEAAGVNMLSGMAGGTNQTAAITARQADKQVVRNWYKPALKTELDAANTAGLLKPKFDAEAQRMGAAAASKVEDVRRFTAAGERAGGRAHTTTLDAAGNPVAAVTSVPGYPRQPGRYTYMGELEKKAPQVAQQAADASLPLGEAARFAKWQSDALEAGGLRPLTPDSVIGGLKKTLTDPDFAGNANIENVARDVLGRVKEWTYPNGTINARALDSIRKDAVNTAVGKLSNGLDPAADKLLAAKVSAKMSPMIVNAIENAGGTGYGRILKEFAKQRQVIDQKELGATALDLFKTNKGGFVDLVGGDATKTVNNIFGRGELGYDIAAQMSPKNMRLLRETADLTKRGLLASDQATRGQVGLNDVMFKNTSTFKLPNTLTPAVTWTNRALGYLEKKFGADAMETLTAGMRSGKSADQMLAVLPAKERVELLKAMQKPELWMVPGGSAAAANAMGGLLSPDQ